MYVQEEMAENGENFDEAKIAENLPEQEILIQVAARPLSFLFLPSS
jgi:hypothetical protein